MTDRTEYFKQYRRRNRSRRNAYQRNYRAKQSGRQPELIPSKKPAPTHRGYPPDNKCPCRECREKARGDLMERVYLTDERTRSNYQRKGQNANDHQL